MKKEMEDLNTLNIMLRALIRNEVRHKMIAEAAYYRAEKRGFQNGDALGDWLAAETAVDQKLANAFLSYTRPAPAGNAEIVEEYALFN